MLRTSYAGDANAAPQLTRISGMVFASIGNNFRPAHPSCALVQLSARNRPLTDLIVAEVHDCRTNGVGAEDDLDARRSPQRLKGPGPVPTG